MLPYSTWQMISPAAFPAATKCFVARACWPEPGAWDPREVLSPGQAEQIDRVHGAYPHLNDDAFVRDNLDRWLAG